jgi:hypothetical protein
VGESRIKRAAALLLLGFVATACEGVIGGSGAVGGPRQDGEPSFEGVIGSASESTLLRLTKAQHQNTVSTLLTEFLGERAGSVMGAVQPVYAIIPDDEASLEIGGLVGATFSRMAQAVGELHVRGYFDVATTVATEVAYDTELREAMFGECVSEASSDHSACMESFIETFGLWAMRRPLSDEEIDFFLDGIFADDGLSYEATPESLRDLLVGFLVAPDFIYRVNTRGEEIGDGLFELDAYELASRLSYHFWDTMPDRELLEAAADGTLATEAGYAAEVDRVYADPKTAESFRRFVYEWLKLYEAGDAHGGVTSGDPQKMTFIEGYDVTPQLRDNMIDEVLDMAEYYRASGTFEDFFTSRSSFAKTTDLADIYGVPVWDGESVPEPFPDSQRVGLLGRAALLASETVATHPILRGVRIRQDFMCDSLGTPPANVNEVKPDLALVATTRERTENLTSPGSCAGCHNYINGLGFPLEAFDSLGRYRNQEMFIDEEGSLEMLPLDLEAIPYVDGLSDTATVDGPAELVDELLFSGKLEGCFAQHYVRFTLGLLADPAFGGDSATVDALTSQIREGVALGEVFKSIAFAPAFKQRLKGGDN